MELTEQIVEIFRFQMLRVLTLILFLVSLSYGFLEEAEGVDPGNRVCDPDEERAAQSCKNVSRID